MKKSNLAVLMTIVTTFLNAQNATYDNVVIGTTSPAYGVKIKANFPGQNGGWARGFSVSNETGSENYITLGSLGTNTNGVTNVVNSYIGMDYNNQYMTFLANSNIGIGTKTPVSKLTLEGSLTLNSGLNNTSVRPVISTSTMTNGEIRAYSSAGNAFDDGFLRLSAGGGTNASTKSFIDISGHSSVPDMARNIVFGTYGLERMRIDLLGNVGVGIKDPKNKLDVNGTIHSKEVKVDMLGWSDFVFKKEYKLPTLEEVEKHINEKGYLENIPSEKEILENGINLGEMNAKLLQKIEELTLYSIDQNKKIVAQAKEIESLKDLVLRVTKIESELARK